MAATNSGDGRRIIVSPTEPPTLRAIGSSVSMFPEKYGCDAIWRVFGDDKERAGWVGVQRKELADLLASIRDGRLGQQLRQMDPLKMAMVIVEGKMRWSTDGELVSGPASHAKSSANGRPWTKKQIAGVLWSIQAKGVWVYYTDSLDETIQAVQMFADWSAKDVHTGLESRGGPKGDGWGRVQRIDWQRHLLMGLPGIGRELATRILNTIGMPLGPKWENTEAAFNEVEGMGPKKIKAVMEILLEGDEEN